MMIRRFKDMKSLNYHGEQLKGSSSVKKLPDPNSHIHIPFPRCLDPEEVAKVFPEKIEEDLAKMTIENNKASLETILSQKPTPKRRMKI